MDEEDTEIIAKRGAEKDNTAKTTPLAKPSEENDNTNGKM